MSEIANRTGFFDSAHFTKRFVKENGISPFKYRNLNKQTWSYGNPQYSAYVEILKNVPYTIYLNSNHFRKLSPSPIRKTEFSRHNKLSGRLTHFHTLFVGSIPITRSTNPCIKLLLHWVRFPLPTPKHFHNSAFHKCFQISHHHRRTSNNSPQHKKGSRPKSTSF